MSEDFGLIVEGDRERLQKSYEEFNKIPIDLDLCDDNKKKIHKSRKTIVEPTELSGRGTFFGKEIRNLRFEPYEKDGWWIDRTDRKQSLPIKVSVRNVWTTGDIVSNIVLRSGSNDNYIRLVEHIIALKAGLDIDNLMVRMDSGDPPLFDNGSLDLVEAVNSAGRKELSDPLKYYTVSQPVSYVRSNGCFLVFYPNDPEKNTLELDCAINFNNAIGKQRIRFNVSPETFTQGCNARTNTNMQAILFSKTIGLLFADIRNLGYTYHNVLIAGKHRYINKPRHENNGKSLEAIWHRSTLDLLAAVSLIEEGRFLGRIVSYKAGHFQDVEMIKLLYANELFREVNI